MIANVQSLVAVHTHTHTHTHTIHLEDRSIASFCNSLNNLKDSKIINRANIALL